eukprot:m.15403 g.15403  ORF g.15403 m.15403 type:complete len:379 (+) comp6665_c0_seq1:107-1243(+)
MSIPILFEADYPLYSIRVRGDEVIVCGGGGVSKTGVPNGLDVFGLEGETAKHLGGFRGLRGAAMNMDLKKTGGLVAVGVDGTATFLSSVKKGKGSEATLEFTEEANLVTDQSKEPFQACIRFNPKGTLVATGGADGSARVWAHPSLKEVFSVVVQKKDAEVDDIDVDNDGHLAAVCGAQAKLFTTGPSGPAAEGKKKTEKSAQEPVTLVWANKSLFAAGKNQTFKFCRFVVVEGTPRLVTVMIPPGPDRGRQQCHLVLWNLETLQPLRSTSTGKAVTSTFAVSDDGVYLGLGDNEGFVSIYQTSTLKCLARRQVHELFVTSVAFHGSSLLSVSVDHYCVRTPLTAGGGGLTLSPAILMALISLFVLLFAYILPLFLSS